MKKNTQYALIFSLGVIFLYLLIDLDSIVASLLPSILVIGAGIYYNNKLTLKKNGRIYLAILLLGLLE